MLLLRMWILIPLSQYLIFIIPPQKRMLLALLTSVLILIKHIASVSLLKSNGFPICLLNFKCLCKLLIKTDQMLPGRLSSTFLSDATYSLEQVYLIRSRTYHVRPQLVALDLIHFCQCQVSIDSDCATFWSQFAERIINDLSYLPLLWDSVCSDQILQQIQPGNIVLISYLLWNAACISVCSCCSVNLHFSTHEDELGCFKQTVECISSELGVTFAN